MAYCYILYSEKLNRFYVGATQETVAERLLKHNNTGYGSNRYTAKANDWEVYLSIRAEDYAHAIRIEQKIKSKKSAKYKRDLLKYPELLLKLITEMKD